MDNQRMASSAPVKSSQAGGGLGVLDAATEEQVQLNVVLVDGDRLFRDGLRGILEEHGIGVAEAASPTEAVSLVADTEPDVAVIDIEMRGATGMEVVQRLRRVSPLTRVVVLTASTRRTHILEAIRSGACGYVLKDSPVELIVASVRAAAAGESLLSPRIAVELIGLLRDCLPEGAAARGSHPKLTSRELDVLRLVARGRDNAEIGAELTISKQTVKSHVSSVLAKLEVDNRVQAAVYAVREGLL